MPTGKSEHGENIMLLTHRAAEVSILSKKYAIGNLRYLVLMWFMLVFGFGFPSILFISLLKAVTGEIPLPNFEIL